VGLRIAAIVAFVTLAGCKDDRPLRADAPEGIDADMSIDAPPAVCAGGTVGYLGACTAPSDCGASCECHDFGHSQVCTMTCNPSDSPSTCPAPSPGCSSTGFCRK
jgi:hypothetical protein